MKVFENSPHSRMIRPRKIISPRAAIDDFSEALPVQFPEKILPENF